MPAKTPDPAFHLDRLARTALALTVAIGSYPSLAAQVSAVDRAFRTLRTEVREALGEDDALDASKRVTAWVEDHPEHLPGHLLHLRVLIESGNVQGAVRVTRTCAMLEPEGSPAFMVLQSALAPEPDTSDSQIVEQLTAQLRHERKKARPDRMLPLIWRARQLAPRDWRIMLLQGEAYGVDSSFFDPVMAEGSFLALRGALVREDRRQTKTRETSRQWRDLMRFLDGADRGDEITPRAFAERVMEFLDQLAEGEPIRLWRRNDADATNRYEAFRAARTRGDQEAALAAATRLSELDAADPVAHFLIGITTGSMGPAFDAGAARHAFGRFLELTEPDRFEDASASGAPELTPDQLLGLIDRLDEQNPVDEFTAMRLQVRKWMTALGDGDELLEVPDREELERRIRHLERSRRRRTSSLEDARAKLRTAESDLRSARSRYDSLRGRTQTNGSLQRAADKVWSCERRVRRYTKDTERNEERLERIDSKLVPMQQRFAQLREPGGR